MGDLCTGFSNTDAEILCEPLHVLKKKTPHLSIYGFILFIEISLPFSTATDGAWPVLSEYPVASV